MRRRIYIDPEGPLDDVTDRPYHFEQDNVGLTACYVGALYNELLWEEYERVQKLANTLERKIRDELVEEPFDEVEVTLHEEDHVLHDVRHPYDPKARDALRARALENAKGKYRRPV